jgi:hypothetical protein
MWGVILLILLLYVCLAARKGFTGGRDIVKDLQTSPRTKSEARVVAELERLTGEQFPTVLPDFMKWKGKRLELDGYCEKLKLAIEFSGPLHTKWFPAKESYEKYAARVETDRKKKELCKAAGVDLIVIDMALPPRHYRDYLASRLHDFGRMQRPDNYIIEQIAEPWLQSS